MPRIGRPGRGCSRKCCGVRSSFLPAYANWMPGDAPPAFDAERGLFVEPYSPHEVIGVMHLAGREQKTHIFRLYRLGGGTVETSLRYSESRALCRRSLGDAA